MKYRFLRNICTLFLLPLLLASCDLFGTDDEQSPAVTEITIQVNGGGRAATALQQRARNLRKNSRIFRFG